MEKRYGAVWALMALLLERQALSLIYISTTLKSLYFLNITKLPKPMLSLRSRDQEIAK